jgi:Na+/glutamate symporter
MRKLYVFLTDIIHFISGLVFSLEPVLALCVTIMYVFRQVIELRFKYENPDDTLGDLNEFMTGLFFGVILKNILRYLYGMHI